MHENRIHKFQNFGHYAGEYPNGCQYQLGIKLTCSLLTYINCELILLYYIKDIFHDGKILLQIHGNQVKDQT